MNKFKKTTSLTALFMVLFGFLITSFNTAIASSSTSGLVSAEFCDFVVSAKDEEKKVKREKKNLIANNA